MKIKNTINWLLGRQAVVQTATAIMEDAANFIAERMRTYAPVDTGDLQRSIGVLTYLNDRGDLAYKIICTVPYASVIEYGHYTTRGLFVAPNPFGRKALADGIAQFPSIAGRHKLSGGERTVSGAAQPSEGGYRNVTFASAADMGAESSAGSFSGGGGGLGISLGD